jgi:hypothetical protein
MKKVIISLLVAVSVWAAPYTVGQSVILPDLNDQFGKRVTLTTMPKTLIMAFEKGTAATVNEYLAAQDNGYLSKNKAAFVAEISQMPKFIAEAFALPKMRNYTHTILLIRDEEEGLKFPYQEEKITVMTFRDNTLMSIEFISTAEELKKAIEQ